MATVPTTNLDIKREQLLELQLQEAYKRGKAIKAYEVLSSHQLPVPEGLSHLIRPNTKPKNLIRQLANRELTGQAATEDLLATFTPDLTTIITPAPILAKALDVNTREQQDLIDLTGQTKLDPDSWIIASHRYNQLKSELASPAPPGSNTN